MEYVKQGPILEKKQFADIVILDTGYLPETRRNAKPKVRIALSPSRYSSQSGAIQNSMHDTRNNMSVAASNPALPPMSQAVDRRPMSLPSRGASPVERIQLPSIRNVSTRS